MPRSTERAAAKSKAAEAWDAIKDTSNPALLEAFIKRFGTTFFAEIAKARLKELKTAAAKPRNRAAIALQVPADGIRERAVLYEEDVSDPKGRRFDGAVIWHTDAIKASGKPDELAARAEVDIPSLGLRMRMSFKRNLDSSLPASHLIDVTVTVPGDFKAGGVTNVPGILMKSNEQGRGTPMAALAVKITEGAFLVGLSAVDADRQRNLQMLSERSWFDIPIVYANQKRAILAIEKGASGQQVLKTVFTAWGTYPDSTEPENAASEESRRNGSVR